MGNIKKFGALAAFIPALFLAGCGDGDTTTTKEKEKETTWTIPKLADATSVKVDLGSDKKLTAALKVELKAGAIQSEYSGDEKPVNATVDSNNVLILTLNKEIDADETVTITLPKTQAEAITAVTATGKGHTDSKKGAVMTVAANYTAITGVTADNANAITVPAVKANGTAAEKTFSKVTSSDSANITVSSLVGTADDAETTDVPGVVVASSGTSHVTLADFEKAYTAALVLESKGTDASERIIINAKQTSIVPAGVATTAGTAAKLSVYTCGNDKATINFAGTGWSKSNDATKEPATTWGKSSAVTNNCIMIGSDQLGTRRVLEERLQANVAHEGQDF